MESLQTGSSVSQPAQNAGPLIHPLSAVLLIAIDNLWNLADWAALLWIVTIPLCFFVTLIPVYFIQRHIRRDHSGRAMAVALLLAVLAAIPTSVTGTLVGAVVLGFAGVRFLRKWL